MEAPYRLRFWDALRARLMGDAIGNILPFASFVVSEPAKPALIRDRVPLMAGFSAIVIENIFYSLSVVVFVFSGMLALLLNFSLPKGLRLASLITLVSYCADDRGGRGADSRATKICQRRDSFLHRRGLNEKWVGKPARWKIVFMDSTGGTVRDFYRSLFLEACFHLAGVAEIYVTLSFISPQQPPTLFTAFILESVNRVITMAFKFIPLRMGVDEAGTGKVSKSAAIHRSSRCHAGDCS